MDQEVLVATQAEDLICSLVAVVDSAVVDRPVIGEIIKKKELTAPFFFAIFIHMLNIVQLIAKFTCHTNNNYQQDSIN